MDDQFSAADDESEVRMLLSVMVVNYMQLIQAKTYTCGKVCNEVCVGIPCEIKSMQISMVVVETVALGTVLPFQVPGESVPKVPDQCTTVCCSDGSCVVCGSSRNRDGPAHVKVSVSGLVGVTDGIGVFALRLRGFPFTMRGDGFVASDFTSSRWF